MFKLSIRQSIFILLVVLIGAPVSAAPTSTPSTATTAKAKATTRLADAKLTACQSREAAIQKRSEQLVKLATNMQDTFTSIASRVKEYYTTKVIPSGETVDNYDDLLATIASKQEAVATALAKTQSDAMAFSCTSDDPKGQLTQYRTNMQTVKSALKEYRTSIKDLIVAIRSLTGKTESSASPKASSSPTTSPTTSP